MYLRSIALRGYRSAAHAEELSISDLGRFNVFIGPNNSGKSTVCRFVQVVSSLVEKRSALSFALPWENVDASWWWQGHTSTPIEALLTFSGSPPAHDVDPHAPGRFGHDNEWRLSVTLAAVPQKECRVLIVPHVFVNGGWHPIVRTVTTPRGTETVNLNRNGEYVSTTGSDACPYHGGGLEVLRAWANCVRFYDPIRAIDRNAGRRELADGSDLLDRLHRLQLDQKQTHAFEQFRRQLIRELNALLFEPNSADLIEFFEVKGTEKNRDLYVKRRGDEAPIALQYMGTGIAELTVLLSDILQTDGVRQYFVEEPECHLHPGLLRRLMTRLQASTDAQFFITSHSNAVLDSLTAKDRIYRFAFSPQVGTTVARCTTLDDQHGVLDALGVSGATLLQTNCAIWAEGPSDRVYLRFWLERQAQRRGVALIEGSDFSFVFYGGKILSHFAFSDEGQRDLISMVRLSRFSAVIMDKDTSDESTTEGFRATKSRVREEAQKDPQHRLAVLTRGREIENDVDPTVFRRAAEKVLRLDAGTLSQLRLSGKRRFMAEVAAHLGLAGPEADKVRRRLSDKVGLATAVVAEWSDDANIPAYVDDLLELILRSRVL